MPQSPRYKIPVSTLVVVYTRELDVLLIERADFPEHWQSVTGSQEPGETLEETATRELREETGIDAELYGGVVDWHVQNDFEICVPRDVPVALAPREHLRHAWLPWRDAAARCFSWTNRAAIESLPAHL